MGSPIAQEIVQNSYTIQGYDGCSCARPASITPFGGAVATVTTTQTKSRVKT